MLKKSRFWSVILGIMLILSESLAFSIRQSSAQTPIPDEIRDRPDLLDLLQSFNQSLDAVLKSRNERLEEQASAAGRELQEGERVTVVRRVLLRPHPASPVKDVVVEAYELSDGSTGQTIGGPVMGPEVTEPTGGQLVDFNMDEGWYIVRPLTAEELQQVIPQKPPEPASTREEGQPLSLLERIITFLGPSEVIACPSGCWPALNPPPWQRRVRALLRDAAGTLVDDNVFARWTANAQTCIPQLLSSSGQCLPSAGWRTYQNSPCSGVTNGINWGGSLYSDHSQQYESPQGTTTAYMESRINMSADGSWTFFTSCSPIVGPLKPFLSCTFATSSS